MPMTQTLTTHQQRPFMAAMKGLHGFLGLAISLVLLSGCQTTPKITPMKALGPPVVQKLGKGMNKLTLTFERDDPAKTKIGMRIVYADSTPPEYTDYGDIDELVISEGDVAARKKVTPRVPGEVLHGFDEHFVAEDFYAQAIEVISKSPGDYLVSIPFGARPHVCELKFQGGQYLSKRYYDPFAAEMAKANARLAAKAKARAKAADREWKRKVKEERRAASGR